jgi:phosphoenolpyruvate carboxykinase (GTP)
MGSETTAAAAGEVGVTRRDPMAMLPFCGYDMGDYWFHWIEMWNDLNIIPEVFNVNWFRTDDNGKFIWPGFGENFRILEWILKRVAGEVKAQNSPIGYLPNPEDINLDGSGVSLDTLKELLSVDKELWQEEIKNIKKFYSQFGTTLPDALKKQLANLEEKVAEL